MQEILSRMRAAITKYNMINDGDVVAVGVSGGKDSLILLSAMNRLSKFYPKKFIIKAITADPCFDGVQTDYSKIKNLCDTLGIEYIIKRTELGNIIFNERKEKNPCSLCARMRRGILHDLAKANGCNKIAFGHHYDDAIETFFMNLFNGGSIACFSPVTYLSNKDITLIRPMVLVPERMIVNTANKLELPVTKSCCPADGVTERQNTKELIVELSAKYPDLKAKVIGAMQRAGISGWGDISD